MPKRIEEIFNDCFERLLMGENYESLLSRYPEHAVELDIMLRTAYDVKRRTHPIQPRPEFKYWARVRMEGVQDYVARHPAEEKHSAFHWKRSWAVALTAILVFVLASGGTAAASSQAMPDQPLYGVKLAVEQAQLALTFSDADRAELHATLAEKRAYEIVNMAGQGKTDKVITTTTRMNYQLEQAILAMQKYDSADDDSSTGQSESTAPAFNIPPTVPATPAVPVSPALPAVPAAPTIPAAPAIPAAPTMPAVPAAPAIPAATSIIPADKTATNEKEPGTTARQAPVKPPLPPAVIRAKNAMAATNVKSIAALQQALEKAPDSVKPTIRELIKRTQQANEHIRAPLPHKPDQRPLNLPLKPDQRPFVKPPLDGDKPDDGSRPFNVKPGTNIPDGAPKPLPPNQRGKFEQNNTHTQIDDNGTNTNNSQNTSSVNPDKPLLPVTLPPKIYNPVVNPGSTSPTIKPPIVK